MPGHVLRKPSLIDLRRLVVVGKNSAAWKYIVNFGFVVWAIILFTTVFDCCVTRETYHITACLLLVPFNIICHIFLVQCDGASIITQYPQQYEWAVIIFGEMCICLTSFVRPSSWIVSSFYNSIVIPYDSLAVMFFGIMMWAIVGVYSFFRCMFAPQSAIASMYLLGDLGGVLILLIKLILGVLI